MTTKKFKGSFDKIETKGSEFTTIIKDYNLIENSKGELDLIECGEHDIQEEINSYKDDCDINLLIEKYLKGDPNTGINTPFNTTDLTEIDIDLNTAYQKMNEANENPIINEFFEKTKGITNKNMMDKFNEFIKTKEPKKEEPKQEEKKKENE